MIGADFENMTDKIRATAYFNDQSSFVSSLIFCVFVRGNGALTVDIV
jgi:hypothetical protein